MAQIPCGDYVTPPVAVVPKRIVCTTRTCVQNRFVAFVASLDLAPQQSDELGGTVAWSLWDIPASHAAQIDDDRGEDLIVVSIADKVYWLDDSRYRDEWGWNSFAPIYRMVRFGPIPSNITTTQTKGYDLDKVKRFREFQWTLADGATGAPEPYWTVSVGDIHRESKTTRSTQRRTTSRMRAQVAVKGRAFMVTLEHSANEPVNITNWLAKWDVLGTRVKESGQ